MKSNIFTKNVKKALGNEKIYCKALGDNTFVVCNRYVQFRMSNTEYADIFPVVKHLPGDWKFDKKDGFK